MIAINTYIGLKLKKTLSDFALYRNSIDGPGIVNIRSYDLIESFSVDASQGGARTLFISYIPIDQWKGLVVENDYSKSMIVNFHIENMNKPQLHKLRIDSDGESVQKNRIFSIEF
jgi:hypothetical protein